MDDHYDTAYSLDRLRNGKGIHTVSALILQLVQSTGHEVAARVESSLNKLHRDGATDGNDNEAAAVCAHSCFDFAKIIVRSKHGENLLHPLSNLLK